MCRLLAFAGPRPTDFATAVGREALAEFVQLAHVHRDGWGIAWKGAEGLSLHKSANIAVGEFDSTVADVYATSGIAHLRWATVGIGLSLQNTHPFVADGLAFAHNGTIADAELLYTMLPVHHRVALRGSTDSELWFALVRAAMEDEGLDLTTAVATVVRRLRPLFPQASFNALFLSDAELIAVNASNDAVLSPNLYDYCQTMNLPTEHNEDYFQLRLARTREGGIVIGSTGFGNLDWTPLAPESVTRVDLSDLSVDTWQLQRLGSDADEVRV